MNLLNRLHVNWGIVGVCLLLLTAWRMAYRVVQILFFHF